MRIQDQDDASRSIYRDIFDYSADLFIYFCEKSLSFIKEDGIFTYIVSNKWLKTNYGKEIRTKFKNKHLLRLIDFQGIKIFKDADVDSSIFILKNKMNNGMFVTKIGENNNLFYDYNKKTLVKIPEFEINIKKSFEDVFITDGSVLPFYFKMLENKTNNSIHIYKGFSTGNDDIYKLEYKDKIKSNLVLCFSEFKNENITIEKEILRKYIQGEDLGMLNNKSKVSLLLLFPYHNNGNLFEINFIKENYPYAFEYLNFCKKELLKRKGKFQKNDWYRFSAMRNFDTYNKPKILLSDMVSDSIKILIDNDNYFHNASIHNIPIDGLDNIDGKFLVGLFISKAFLCYNMIIGEKLAEAGRVIPKNVEKFPIPNVSLEQQQPIISKVDKILSIKKENPQADTSGLEHEIDVLIYGLYDLKDDKIKIVEGT